MGISVLTENLLNGRDLAAARDAYQTRDAAASKTAHTAGAHAAGSRRHHSRQCPRSTCAAGTCASQRVYVGTWLLAALGSPTHGERPAPSHSASYDCSS